MAAVNTTATKVVQTPLLAWQTVANGVVTPSSSFNCANTLSGSVGISIGRRTAVAFTAGWPNIRIEAAKVDSPTNMDWIPILLYQPSIGSSVANSTLNGAVAIGATNFVVNAATGITVGDVVYLSDAANNNFEICRVLSVSGNTVTPEATLVKNHANASIVSDQAEIYMQTVPLFEYRTIRAVADNANSGQNIAVEVTLTTVDNVTSV